MLKILFSADPGGPLLIPAADDPIIDELAGPRRILRGGPAAISHVLRAPSVTADLRALPTEQAAAFLDSACLRAWRYDRLRTQPREDDPRLQTLHVLTDDAALEPLWTRRQAAVAGLGFARDLVTEPANTLTPAGFIDRLAVLTTHGITLTVLQGQALHEARLTGLLAVGGGSANPPALAILRWPGTLGTSPVMFVGKGITFDTGGLCIKPADKMWEMRADMAGAAACTGALLALALRHSPAPAMAVLALAENTTSETAYRPSDILRHADGTTIEVIDTDAEGRLVLADALGWAVRQSPAAIIDLATLTGSVVTALGHEMAGLFSNDDSLAASVAAAGAATGERVWRLPIAEGHRRALDSAIADVRHCSPERGQPDACQAAAFLRHFVGDTPWVHLDIAGVESRAEASPEHAAGATGFGVRLLDRLVADRFEDPHRA
jgi:leucyl aminopeptidase